MTSRGKKFFILRLLRCVLGGLGTRFLRFLKQNSLLVEADQPEDYSRRFRGNAAGATRSLRAYDLPISRVKDFCQTSSLNGQQALQVPACFALIESLREGSRRDLRKDFFKVEPLPIPLELVAENELIAFPLRQMRHENAAGGIFAVTPERSVSSRFLVPPSHTQARNFSAGFFQMNLLDY